MKQSDKCRMSIKAAGFMDSSADKCGMAHKLTVTCNGTVEEQRTCPLWAAKFNTGGVGSIQIIQ